MKSKSLSGVVVSDREALFLHALEGGLPPAAAAAKAGYSNPAATARALLQRPHIQNEIASIQARMADTLQVSRTRVYSMLEQAYNMAVEQGNPTAVVRVASELNRMCGYYHDTHSQKNQTIEGLTEAMTASPLEDAPDDELINISGLDNE